MVPLRVSVHPPPSLNNRFADLPPRKADEIFGRLSGIGHPHTMIMDYPGGIISGSVSFKGKEATSGTVTFFTRGKVFEPEIQDGSYLINRVPLGKAKITVVHVDTELPVRRDALFQARK